MNKLFGSVGLLIFLAIVVLLGLNSFYTVGMTEQVLVTQGGAMVGKPVLDAGLHFKVPFIQKVNRIEKLVLEWDGPATEMPTRDKTNIIVDAFGRWRIADPLVYFQKVGDERSAASRLNDILGSEIRKTVGSHEAAEIIRSTVGREAQQIDTVVESEEEVGQLRPVRLGRVKIEQEIKARAEGKLTGWGIELLDVRLKRVNYQPGVQDKIYSRMISERARIAERFRSEGDGEADRILGDMDREMKSIESEAYREVETIRGKADAEAAGIYSEAYDQSPDAAKFYEFLQTMEIYRTILGKDTTLVLSTDSDLFQFLKAMEPGSREKKGSADYDPAGELPPFLRDN